MDLTQLANLGEFIGGVAVLVTLVYLAIQLRQGNAREQTENIRTFFQQWSQAAHGPLRDRDFCRVMQAAGRDFEGLDEEDRLVAHGYWMAIGLLGYQIFQSRDLDPAAADLFNSLFIATMKNPGASDWWRTSKVLVSPDYLGYLESLDGPELLPLKDVHPWFVAGASAP